MKPLLTLTCNGVTHTYAEWAAIVGASAETIRQRIVRFKMTPAQALGYEKRYVNPRCTYVTCNGVTDTVRGWARKLGMSGSTLNHYLLRTGNTIQDLLDGKAKLNKPKEYTYNGLSLTAPQWARRIGISPATMHYRIRQLEAGKLDPETCFSIGTLDTQKEFSFGGETHTTSGWAKKLNISVMCFRSRVYAAKRGIMTYSSVFRSGRIGADERIFEKNKRYVVSGIKYSIHDLSKKYGVGEWAIRQKILELGLDKTVEWLKNPYRRYHGIQFVDGLRMTSDEAARRVGLKGHASLNSRRSYGWSDRDICEKPRLSLTEAHRLACASRKRNNHRRRMLKMGIVT